MVNFSIIEIGDRLFRPHILQIIPGLLCILAIDYNSYVLKNILQAIRIFLSFDQMRLTFLNNGEKKAAKLSIEERLQLKHLCFGLFPLQQTSSANTFSFQSLKGAQEIILLKKPGNPGIGNTTKCSFYDHSETHVFRAKTTFNAYWESWLKTKLPCKVNT